MNGQSVWEWVFQSTTASYHVIAPTRGAQVIDEFLDGAKPEVWVSDLAKAQVGAPAAAHQICLAHQLRDLQYAIERTNHPGYGGRWRCSESSGAGSTSSMSAVGSRLSRSCAAVP